MTRLAAVALALALLGAACGEGEPDLPEGFELTPLTEEEVRELSRRETMRTLQLAAAAQMRRFVEEGAFTEDPGEVDLPEGLSLVPRVEEGEGPGAVAVSVCEEDAVVVLAATSTMGELFAVKAQGLAPHEEGEAVFSHYVGRVPPCDPAEGPETWPGGWFVSRQGLQGPEEEEGAGP